MSLNGLWIDHEIFYFLGQILCDCCIQSIEIYTSKRRRDETVVELPVAAITGGVGDSNFLTLVYLLYVNEG